jgi:hypothetical protein
LLSRLGRLIELLDTIIMIRQQLKGLVQRTVLCRAGFSKEFKDKETAEEKRFANVETERILKKLMEEYKLERK